MLEGRSEFFRVDRDGNCVSEFSVGCLGDRLFFDFFTPAEDLFERTDRVKPFDIIDNRFALRVPPECVVDWLTNDVYDMVTEDQHKDDGNRESDNGFPQMDSEHFKVLTEAHRSIVEKVF